MSENQHMQNLYVKNSTAHWILEDTTPTQQPCLVIHTGTWQHGSPHHPKFLVILKFHQGHGYNNLKQVDNQPRTLFSSASGGIDYMRNPNRYYTVRVGLPKVQQDTQ